MMRALAFFGSCLAIVAGCGAETPATVTPPPVASAIADASSIPPSPVDQPDAATATTDAGAPKKVSCQLPPFDMVKDNIASTSVSGLAEIVSSTATGLDGKTPAPKSGYVNWRYTLRVVKWFSGTGPEQITLSQGAEAPGTPPPAGQLLFFSACSSSKDTVYEPDVGYVFPLDPSCRADAESLGTSAGAKAGAPKKKPKACDAKK